MSSPQPNNPNGPKRAYRINRPKSQIAAIQARWQQRQLSNLSGGKVGWTLPPNLQAKIAAQNAAMNNPAVPNATGGMPPPATPKKRGRAGLQAGGVGPQNRRTQNAIQKAVNQGLIQPGPNAGGPVATIPPPVINIPRNPALDAAQERAANLQSQALINAQQAHGGGVNKTVVIAVIVIGGVGLLKTYTNPGESPGPVFIGTIGLLIFLSLFDLIPQMRPVVTAFAAMAIAVVLLQDLPVILPKLGSNILASAASAGSNTPLAKAGN